MEDKAESWRLDLKTDKEAVKRQAAWAGISPGMRVLDVGCGSGSATSALAELVGPTGFLTAIDISEDRLEAARKNYSGENIEYLRHDIRSPFINSTQFDAVWSRFFLEYFRRNQREILFNSLMSLRNGGIACIADLDNNSLGHFGMSQRLITTLKYIMELLENQGDFDPYAGRKIYGHLHALGYKSISCTLEAHHLVCGSGNAKERYNWMRKVDVAVKNSGYCFPEYDGDYSQFRNEVKEFLESPSRFTYTPLIIVRGIKP